MLKAKGYFEIGDCLMLRMGEECWKEPSVLVILMQEIKY